MNSIECQTSLNELIDHIGRLADDSLSVKRLKYDKLYDTLQDAQFKLDSIIRLEAIESEERQQTVDKLKKEMLDV